MLFLTVAQLMLMCHHAYQNFTVLLSSILSVLGSKRNEMLSVFMVRQYCLPSVTYGSEIWYTTTDNKLRPLEDIAWNNAFRKIFNGFWRSRERYDTSVLLQILTCHTSWPI